MSWLLNNIFLKKYSFDTFKTYTSTLLHSLPLLYGIFFHLFWRITKKGEEEIFILSSIYFFFFFDMKITENSIVVYKNHCTSFVSFLKYPNKICHFLSKKNVLPWSEFQEKGRLTWIEKRLKNSYLQAQKNYWNRIVDYTSKKNPTGIQPIFLLAWQGFVYIWKAIDCCTVFYHT